MEGLQQQGAQARPGVFDSLEVAGLSVGKFRV